MEVILLENMRKLGKFGDKVSVSNGYGRNYLIPQEKALPASQENIIRFEKERLALEKKATSRLEEAQQRATAIEALHFTLSARASEEGKLYGSIGTAELVHAFEEAGIAVAKREIRLPNGPFREIGTFDLEIQLHPEVVARAKISIVPEAQTS